MRKFNEDTRVKIPATVQFMRIGYAYQSLKDINYHSGTRIIILGHLSQQNNTCDLALDTHLQRVLSQGLIPGEDIEFGMTWPDHPSHIFTI